MQGVPAEPKEETARDWPRSWLCGAAAQAAESHRVARNMATRDLTTAGHSELTQKTAPREGNQASLGDIGDFFPPACSDLVMGFNSLIATQTPSCHIQ